jgi:hypothetical protein
MIVMSIQNIMSSTNASQMMLLGLGITVMIHGMGIPR